MQDNSVQQAEMDEGNDGSLLLRAQIASNIERGRSARQQANTVSERLTALWRKLEW